MSNYKTVTLTELEYHKLLRYTEYIASVEAQAQLVLRQLQDKIQEAHRMKDAYFGELMAVHPDLSRNVDYTPHDADFTLTPNVKEGE